MRAIALAAFFGVVGCGQGTVGLNHIVRENKGDCEVSFTATGKLPSAVATPEVGKTAGLSSLNKGLAAYFVPGSATYTTAADKTITFHFRVNRSPAETISGDGRLTTAPDSPFKK